MAGIVESDETFVLKPFKDKRRGLPCKARKRGGASAKRGQPAEQIPVIVTRDRSGTTTDAVLPRLSRVPIAAALDGVVTPVNTFCCDGGGEIVAFACRAGSTAQSLAKIGQARPSRLCLHLNNVNAYHERLKAWLRRFHDVATKNVSNYLGWQRALDALGQRVSAVALEARGYSAFLTRATGAGIAILDRLQEHSERLR